VHELKWSVSSLNRRARNEVALRRRGSSRRNRPSGATRPTKGCRAASGVASLGTYPRAAWLPSQVLANPSLKLTRNGLPRRPVGGRFAHFPPTARRGKPLRSA